MWEVYRQLWPPLYLEVYNQFKDQTPPPPKATPCHPFSFVSELFDIFLFCSFVSELLDVLFFFFLYLLLHRGRLFLSAHNSLQMKENVIWNQENPPSELTDWTVFADGWRRRNRLWVVSFHWPSAQTMPQDKEGLATLTRS